MDEKKAKGEGRGGGGGGGDIVTIGYTIKSHAIEKTLGASKNYRDGNILYSAVKTEGQRQRTTVMSGNASRGENIQVLIKGRTTITAV